MSTTLPSFIELMQTLGLSSSQARKKASATPATRPSPRPSHARSKSSPQHHRQSDAKGARYSPYSSTFPANRLRSKSSAENTQPPTRYRSMPQMRSHEASHNSALTLNNYGSSTDLSTADTPISSFVRRKTPGASPSSPYPPTRIADSTSSLHDEPFSLPTLPPMFLALDSSRARKSSDSNAEESKKSLQTPTMRRGIRISNPRRSSPDPPSHSGKLVHAV